MFNVCITFFLYAGDEAVIQPRKEALHVRRAEQRFEIRTVRRCEQETEMGMERSEDLVFKKGWDKTDLGMN